MTSRKANTIGMTLQSALQVFFMNEAAVEERDKVLVGFKGSTNVKGIRSFLFYVKASKVFVFDTHALAQEIVKIVPNIAITEVCCYFFSRSISVICKELGKAGTYSFDFAHVMP